MDTGAFATILEDTFARKARLATKELDGPIIGLSSRNERAFLAHLQTLQLGGWMARGYPVADAKLKIWSTTDVTGERPQIRGLLGGMC